MAGREQPVVPDAREALREHMVDEAPEKLDARERALPAALRREGHAALVHRAEFMRTTPIRPANGVGGPSLSARGGAFDEQRGVLVVPAGPIVWEWDRVQWSIHIPATWLDVEAMAYDPVRGELVAMGRVGLERVFGAWDGAERWPDAGWQLLRFGRRRHAERDQLCGQRLAADGERLVGE